MDPSREHAGRARELGQRVLAPTDADWPTGPFRALHGPPRVLYLRGRLPPPGSRLVALVGTRRATPYGERVAREIAEDLARHGCWVVSGLAVGIDAAAHEGALLGAACGGGGTLAVLGCGIDVPYPAENLALKEEIAAKGGVLSEYPPGTPAEKWRFPARNRIVAALSEAVVVVEAPFKSGALITAGLAVEMGREVLVVPGPVGRFTHEGCHALLKRTGAHLCLCASDVLEVLGMDLDAAPAAAGEAPGPPPGPALVVWGVLDPDEALDPDEICRRTGLGPSEVSIGLASLEVEGRVVRVPGVGFRRATVRSGKRR